ncbi:MAG: sulfatase [Nitrososphaerales archaeon]
MKKLLGIAAVSILIILVSIYGIVTTSDETKTRPNIVVIMADDQRWDMIQYMPNVMKLADEGITFTNSFVSTPLCCPSRASFLTGQYAHTHEVLTNEPPYGGVQRFNDNETLPVWLKEAGYTTGLVGKYLNGYERILPYVAPGWDEWQVIDGMHFYAYNMSENGIIRTFGDSESDYSTDILTDKALHFIQNAEQPFFLLFTPIAPHVDAHTPFPIPAQRHVGTCDDIKRTKPPNFNEWDVDDKPKWVKNRPILGRSDRNYLDTLWREQICSLKAVDEAVAKILNALRAESENTVIIYTSDNGYALGEHRLRGKKNCIYEECNRVPLIISYSKLTKRGIQLDELVQNIDLAPTIAELAHTSPAIMINGKSLLTLINNPEAKWSDSILIEYFFRGGTKQHNATAVRDMQFKYVELSTGERELYDMLNDPYELKNKIHDEAYSSIVEQWKGVLEELKLE